MRPAKAASRFCLRMLTWPVVPARTVASTASTQTLRPSMRASPATIASAGAGSSRRCSGSASRPELVEGARVDQGVDALARGQAPGGVVAGDPLRPAHRQGGLAPARQLLDALGRVGRGGLGGGGSGPRRLGAHRPSNAGGRFSTNAATPSAWSSLPCSIATASIDVRVALPGVPPQERLRRGQRQRRLLGDQRRPGARPRPGGRPRATTTLTSPARRASWASSGRPVMTMYFIQCMFSVRAAAHDPDAGDQPDRRLGHPEAGGLVGHDDVADQRQLAAAAEGVAVHRRDDRRRRGLDRAERADRLLHVGAPVGRRRRARRSRRCRRRPRSSGPRRGSRRPARPGRPGAPPAPRAARRRSRASSR